jgi:hypothetical protein
MTQRRFIIWIKKHRDVPTIVIIIEGKGAPRRDMLASVKFFNLY